MKVSCTVIAYLTRKETRSLLLLVFALPIICNNYMFHTGTCQVLLKKTTVNVTCFTSY